MTKPALDIPALHYLLWCDADERHAVRVTQTVLAADLCVTKFVLNRAMQTLEREGRIEPVSKAKAGQLYEVADPADFYEENGA